MCEKLSILELDDKICDSCRKQLVKLPSTKVDSTELTEADSSDPNANLQESVLGEQASLVSLNQCLSAIGETPITKKKLRRVKYPRANPFYSWEKWDSESIDCFTTEVDYKKSPIWG